jgi:CheY-like chemotaxis protein
MESSNERRPILVVDDDADIRDALKDTLEEQGYAVVEASDGAAALSYLRAHAPPGLILLDWNMAPMNAPTFMDAMGNEPNCAQVPVVLLTADTRAQDKIGANRCVGYLKKPVKLEALFDAVSRYVGP